MVFENMEIRTAVAEDASQILEIYTPVVEHTAISFELIVPSINEISNRIESYTKSHEWLVAESSGIVLGYAYASSHRSRDAYKHSVETSVYIRDNSRGSGLGKQLYNELFKKLNDKGFHSAYAGIAMPNAASEALHRSVGFKPIGIFEEIGFKHDKWHDVSWWQRRIATETGVRTQGTK